MTEKVEKTTRQDSVGVSEFPFEFHTVILELADKRNWSFKLLSTLSGGLSGAHLYQVAVYDADTSHLIGHFVLKLARIHDTRVGEASVHERARSMLPEPFRSRHTLPLEAAAHDQSTGTSALVYPIAGESLSDVSPIGTLRAASDMSVAASKISQYLLAEWQGAIPYAQQAHPHSVLWEWLKGRIIIQDNDALVEFLRNVCGYDASQEGLIVNGEVLPNPIFYLNNRSAWPQMRSLSVARSFAHGDLNINNILLRFDPNIGEIEEYYLIDLAYFRESTPLFYDLLFLELSYLINRVMRLSGVLIDDVSEAFLHLTTKMPGKSKIDVDFAGWANVLHSMRTTFDEWIRESTEGLYDDFWGIYHLAGLPPV